MSAIGSASIDGGTGDVIGLKVEIYLGALGWIDVSPSVYYRDKIHISRGRSDETSQPQPQTCGLTLNNRLGPFTPRNATGPYYQLIGRNTPIRVSRLNNGVRRYRYHGEVPTWPTTSDISGQDVHEQISASGVLRRLFQGNAPLRSPMFRAMTTGYTSSLVTAYWPCEDAAGSAFLASGLSGGTPLTVVGSPLLAQDASFPCSAALPQVNGSTWSAPLPPYANTTANVVRFLMSVPAAGDPSAAEIVRFTTTGTVVLLQVAYDTSSNGHFEILGQDVAGNSLIAANIGSNLNGSPVRVSVELQQVGTNISWALVTLALGATSAFVWASGSIAGTVGQATSVTINPHINGAIPANPAGLTPTVIGHVSYQPTWDSLYDTAQPLNAWINEPPDAVQPNDLYLASVAGNGPLTMSRFTRLCLESNVTPVVVASRVGYDVDAGPTPPVGMGYQTVDTLTTLLQQVPDTTAGLMFEPRDQLGVAIRTRASLYNQPAKLILDHSQHQLSAPLNPVDDDALTRNDITVTRVNGSSTIAQQTVGTLSMQPAPAGVGDYQTQYQLSLASDALLADAAGWRLHMGTVDEPRYPQISLNLRHPTFTSSVDMMNAALTLDVGDRIVIVNPPPELPPDPISLIVQGYTETLGIYEHDMVLTCSPESPYRVGLLDDATLGHLDTDGSTLALACPLGTETTIQVATTNPASPSWTTSAGDFPFDIAVGGERMTVTNIGAVPQPATGVDGTFESGVTGWAVQNGTLVQSSAQAHSGTHSGLLTANSLLVPAIKTAQFPVVANASYLLNCWAMLAVGAPTSLLLVAQWFDAGGNFITQNVTPAIPPIAAWVQQPIAVPAPSNAVTALIMLDLHVSTTSDAAYIDDLSLTQTTGGTQPFTVTRSVNGVAKSQLVGADVRLQQPMILSL